MVQRTSPSEARQLRPYLTVSRKREGAKTEARQLQVGPLRQFYIDKRLLLVRIIGLTGGRFIRDNNAIFDSSSNSLISFSDP